MTGSAAGRQGITSALLKRPASVWSSSSQRARLNPVIFAQTPSRSAHHTCHLAHLPPYRRPRVTRDLFVSAHSLPRQKRQTSQIRLQSHVAHSTVLSIAGCVLLFLAISSFTLLKTQDHTTSDYKVAAHIEGMAPSAAPGHLGNLTAEQEEKLCRLWQAVLKVCGVQGGNGAPTIPNPSTSAHGEQPVVESEAPRKKRGFGFFKQTHPQVSPSSDSTDTSSQESDDKYGLTKQYQQIIASQRPEDIRETLWSMMKHDHPDALLLRFLRARKWDVEKALVMLISALDWRQNKMKVDPDIMMNGEAGAAASEKNSDDKEKKLGHDFLKQARLGKSFLHGIDKDGRPMCVVRVRLHRSKDQSPESLERYTVFIIETARLALKPPVDTANIIFDMTGFTMANMDYHPVKFMIQCFEANYPESLGVVLVHNAPWVFQGVWKIIRGWLDPVVAAKIRFTNDRADLEEYISPDRIIKELDGDEDWTYKYKEPLVGENDLMKDTEARDGLLKERQKLFAEFDANTQSWIRQSGSETAQQVKAEREEIAARLRDEYWRLDPYVRARSLLDRLDVLRPNGDVDWYRYKESSERRDHLG